MCIKKLLKLPLGFILITLIGIRIEVRAEEGQDIKKLNEKNSVTDSQETAVITDTSSQAPEEEVNPLSLTYTFGLFSSYIFRGQEYYDGPSIQNSFNADYATESLGDVWVNLWSHASGSTSEKNSETKPDFIELDYTVGWTYNIDDFTFTLGHGIYTLPRNRAEKGSGIPFESSNEVIGSVSYDAIIAPTFSFSRDYNQYFYNYYELSFSHTFEFPSVNKDFGVTTFTAFGFGDNSAQVYGKNGLVQITYGASTEIPLGEFSLAPSVNYTQKFDEYTLNKLWFGMNLIYAF